VGTPWAWLSSSDETAHHPNNPPTRNSGHTIEAVEAQLPDADPVKRLQLVQERLDLQAELATKEDAVDLDAVEKGFTAAAKGYSERKGISYAAWREIGVPAATLKVAGITRGG